MSPSPGYFGGEMDGNYTFRQTAFQVRRRDALHEVVQAGRVLCCREFHIVTYNLSPFVEFHIVTLYRSSHCQALSRFTLSPFIEFHIVTLYRDSKLRQEAEAASEAPAEDSSFVEDDW